MVEFELEGMDEEEAINIIQSEYKPIKSVNSKATNGPMSESKKARWKEEKSDNYEALNFDDSYIDEGYDPDIDTEAENETEKDPFTQRMISFQEQGNVHYQATLVNRNILRQINPNDIIVIDWPAPLRRKFYRNLMPDVNIDKCPHCQKLFHTDEYETQLLQCGYCPFCRNPSTLIFK